MLVALAGCTAVNGYPANPIDSSADLAALRSLSAADAIIQYASETDPTRRQGLRNTIAYNRLAAYDIAYQEFESRLSQDSNLQSVAGDLTVLTLNGIGATTGGATAKAALAAASAGVVGAKADIDKDLFYNKALPAVLAQMEASRATQLTVIQNSLKLSDSEYPLALALGDLIKYRDAGSLPSALNILTANANAAKSNAKDDNLSQRPGVLPSFAAPQGTRLVSARSGQVQMVDPAAFVRNLP